MKVDKNQIHSFSCHNLYVFLFLFHLYGELVFCFVAECLVYTKHKEVPHHVLATAVGTVLCQTGDWCRRRNKREHVSLADTSQSSTNSAENCSTVETCGND